MGFRVDKVIQLPQYFNIKPGMGTEGSVSVPGFCCNRRVIELLRFLPQPEPLLCCDVTTGAVFVEPLETVVECLRQGTVLRILLNTWSRYC